MARTAKQRAASKRNLIKARQARQTRRTPKAVRRFDRRNPAGSPWDSPAQIAKAQKKTRVPYGKTVLLIHGTKHGVADKIVKEGFKPTGIKSRKRNAYFLQHAATGVSRSDYGHERVAVKVPKSAIKVRKALWHGDTPEITVPYSALKGRKIKRVL